MNIVAVLSTTVLPLDGVYKVFRVHEAPDIKGVPHYIGHPATKEKGNRGESRRSPGSHETVWRLAARRGCGHICNKAGEERPCPERVFLPTPGRRYGRPGYKNISPPGIDPGGQVRKIVV